MKLDGRSADCRETRTPRTLLAASLCLAFALSACPSPPLTPPGFPELRQTWAPLTQQVPASATSVAILEFNSYARSGLDTIFDTLDNLSPLETRLAVEDFFGIDLTSPATFSQLGLRSEGGVAIFFFDTVFVIIADLDSASQLRDLLRLGLTRNPQLDADWRDLDGSAVLTFRFPESGGERVPRYHALVDSGQLVLALDFSPTPVQDVVDDLLLDTRDGDWSENMTFNQRFGEAVGQLGATNSALMYLQSSDLLVRWPELMAPTAPSPCSDLLSGIASAAPYALAGVDRHRLDHGLDTIESERHRLHIAVVESEQSVVTRLLAPAHVDFQTLESASLAAGYVHLGSDAMREVLPVGGLDLGERCPDAPYWLHVAALAVEHIANEPLLEGTVALGIFDIWERSGYPFAKLLLFLGGRDGDALAVYTQRAVEEGLGEAPSPGGDQDLPQVHYRLGDGIYRMTVFEGTGPVGIAIGTVRESLVRTLLLEPSPETTGFFELVVNGESARAALAAIEQATLTLMATLDTFQSFSVSPQLLDGVRSIRLHGSYDDGWIRLLRVDERLLAPESIEGPN